MGKKLISKYLDYQNSKKRSLHNVLVFLTEVDYSLNDQLLKLVIQASLNSIHLTRNSVFVRFLLNRLHDIYVYQSGTKNIPISKEDVFLGHIFLQIPLLKSNLKIPLLI